MMKASDKHQSGLSLIELMIAITLGLIITAGVIQVFLATRQTNRVTEAHAVLQDNARFALALLSREIRQTGYAGCNVVKNLSVQIIANSPVPAVMDQHTVLTGNEASSSSWSPALDAGLVSKVENGTDVITIIKSSGCGANLVKDMTKTDDNIQVNHPNKCRINPNDVVMISDCENAHVFRVNGTPATGGGQQTLSFANNNQALHLCRGYPSVLPYTGSCSAGSSKLYKTDAEVNLFSAVTYYIGKDTMGTLGLRAYNHLVSASHSTPLVDGIENMQIEYGIDNNDDGVVDKIANAQAVGAASEWDKVISARISLLSQTHEDNITVEKQTYSYNGTAYTATDGKLRRVFTTTIAVRNRVQ